MQHEAIFLVTCDADCNDRIHVTCSYMHAMDQQPILQPVIVLLRVARTVELSCTFRNFAVRKASSVNHVRLFVGVFLVRVAFSDFSNKNKLKRPSNANEFDSG